MGLDRGAARRVDRAGVYVVVWALNAGIIRDTGQSPYHAIVYSGLLALAAISVWLLSGRAGTVGAGGRRSRRGMGRWERDSSRSWPPSCSMSRGGKGSASRPASRTRCPEPRARRRGPVVRGDGPAAGIAAGWRRQAIRWPVTISAGLLRRVDRRRRRVQRHREPMAREAPRHGRGQRRGLGDGCRWRPSDASRPGWRQRRSRATRSGRRTRSRSPMSGSGVPAIPWPATTTSGW